jgi:hypothetical protein
MFSSVEDEEWWGKGTVASVFGGNMGMVHVDLAIAKVGGEGKTYRYRLKRNFC